jgi:hypothetical protein
MISLVYWGITCPLYGISLFLPSIIKDLGYTSSTAQLLTVSIFSAVALEVELVLNNTIRIGTNLYHRSSCCSSCSMVLGSSKAAVTIHSILHGHDCYWVHHLSRIKWSQRTWGRIFWSICRSHRWVALVNMDAKRTGMDS